MKERDTKQAVLDELQQLRRRQRNLLDQANQRMREAREIEKLCRELARQLTED